MLVQRVEQCPFLRETEEWWEVLSDLQGLSKRKIKIR